MKQRPMVLGFMFDSHEKSVVLIVKQRPAWQADRCNGVGGKIEPDESAVDAMVREFHEETGVLTEPSDWRLFCSFGGTGTHGEFHIECFTASSDAYFDAVRTTTDEQVVQFPVSTVFEDNFPSLDKLKWMVALALDKNCTADIKYKVA